MSQKILIVGPSWVGDMVMAQSLFKLLRQRYPDCRLDVLAPEWSFPLLERMPEVEQALAMPIGHGQLGLKHRWQLGRSLRNRYDWAIVLPNSWKSAIVPWAANIAKRTGWRGEMRYGLLNDMRKLDKKRLPMTVQRFNALALPADSQAMPPIPPPRLQAKSDTLAETLAILHLSRPQKCLALCPGAEYGPAKRWPETHYAKLAQHFLQRGWQVWLFGSHKEQLICDNIARLAGEGCLNLAGKTFLGQAVDLLSLADAVVSNDSGLMHVAAALERPLVAIYGSSDPSFTPPLNRRHAIIHLKLECTPCFKRTCPYGHLQCLTQIEPERVWQRIDSLLDQEAQ